MEAAFTSTTKDESIAFPGNVMFEVVSRHGKDVSDFSMIPAEKEVLFDKGTTFYVRSNRFDERLGKQIIILVER